VLQSFDSSFNPSLFTQAPFRIESLQLGVENNDGLKIKSGAISQTRNQKWARKFPEWFKFDEAVFVTYGFKG
jgi:hypothetical protein